MIKPMTPPYWWCAGLAAAHLLIFSLGATPVRATDVDPAAASSEDLGAELFDDALSDPDPGSHRPPKIDRPEFRAASAMLDPLRQLIGAGQGVADQDDWLRVVTMRMQEAHQILAASDAAGGASAAQRAAVDELDALLVKMQKQCDKCCAQCNKPSSSASKQPKPGKSGAKPGASTVQAGPPAKADRSALGRLVNDVWGRLPQRQRDELLQPLSEEFVPEYATETEEYFRALAEPAAAATQGSQP
jgi:hypothetical protein